MMRAIVLALAIFTGLGPSARAAEVTVQSARVHYTVRGAGETVIFVHGWTCDESSWAHQMSAFGRRYRVITLDLPGHGKSAPPARGDYSMAAFAEAVEAVRAATRTERAVLVGHSMGVGVIRRYALDHPDRVAGLVAVDGPLDIRPFAGRPASPPAATAEARLKLIDNMFVPETPQSLRKQITRMMMRTSAATALGASGSMFRPENQSDRIITAPALTIYAGKPVFPPDPETKQMLPDWTSVQLGGSGHFAMMEQPKAFNRLLDAFLSSRARYEGERTKDGPS